jgi:hypothetical protein
MKVFAIYFNPRDYPDKYVMRGYTTVARHTVPDDHCATASSLEEIRNKVPEGLVNIGRDPSDDPCIVECWI